MLAVAMLPLVVFAIVALLGLLACRSRRRANSKWGSGLRAVQVLVSSACCHHSAVAAHPAAATGHDSSSCRARCQVGSAHAEPQAGGGVGEPAPAPMTVRIWVTTMTPMTAPTPARALRPMVATRANGSASRAVSTAPTSVRASPGHGVPAVSPRRAAAESEGDHGRGDGHPDAQASTAMSLAEARAAPGRPGHQQGLDGAVAELASEGPAHDEPDPEQHGHRRHLSGRAGQRVPAHPVDQRTHLDRDLARPAGPAAAAKNPAAIAGTATASSTVTSRPIVDRASLTSSARNAVLTGRPRLPRRVDGPEELSFQIDPVGRQVPTIRPSCITLMVEASRAISSRW